MLCGQEGRAGPQLEEEEEEREEAWRGGGGLRSWPGIDDSATGRGEKSPPPACHSPPTSNMPYYVDLWRWGGQHFQLSQARSIKGFISSQD